MRTEHPTAPAPGPAAPARSVEPDWTAVRERVRTQPWAESILERVREDFDRWEDRLQVPGPGEQTEWTHHYYCDDGTPLHFDPTDPRHHACPACGRVREGEPWDGAWRTKMHNLVASHAQRAALLARLDEDEEARQRAVTALEGIIEGYAAEYEQYAVHGDKVGKGRVMPQNLDESIWTIALLRSVRWAQPLVSGACVRAAEHLAAGVARVLEPQLGMVHNIHCWVVAALAECGARTDDEELLERIRTGPFGLETQIRKGFRTEGLWYETSLFYHYYTLAALLSYREATGPSGLSEQDAAVLARAVAAPAELAYSDGLLPAYGDCWPHGHLDDFAGLAAAAAAVLPGHHLDTAAYADGGVRERPVDLWIGTRWDEGSGSRPLRGPCSIAALVLGPRTAAPPAAEATATPVRNPRESFLWPDAGIGVLRSDRARLTLRFGPDAGMHDHHDKLALDVETTGGWRSLDLGSGGYTSAMTRWMRSPAAHSLAVVHDAVQPPVDGVLEDWSGERVTARATWDGTVVRRALRLTPEGWTDTTEVRTETGGPLMWFLHGDGRVVPASAPEGSTDPVPGEDRSAPVGAADVGSAPGTEWFRDVHELRPDADGVLEVTWTDPGAPRMRIRLPEGAHALAATAPGNPSGRELGILAIRHPSSRAMRIEARAVLGPPAQDPADAARASPPAAPTPSIPASVTARRGDPR